LAFHRELMLFEEIGFTPAQTLRCATLDMAADLGQDQDLGLIACGKLADFFLVPGDAPMARCSAPPCPGRPPARRRGVAGCPAFAGYDRHRPFAWSTWRCP
jgi:cytosine/adenosine deaminase-related metal-dependent hydrolase